MGLRSLFHETLEVSLILRLLMGAILPPVPPSRTQLNRGTVMVRDSRRNLPPLRLHTRDSSVNVLQQKGFGGSPDDISLFIDFQNNCSNL